MRANRRKQLGRDQENQWTGEEERRAHMAASRKLGVGVVMEDFLLGSVNQQRARIPVKGKPELTDEGNRGVEGVKRNFGKGA